MVVMLESPLVEYLVGLMVEKKAAWLGRMMVSTLVVLRVHW